MNNFKMIRIHTPILLSQWIKDNALDHDDEVLVSLQIYVDKLLQLIPEYIYNPEEQNFAYKIRDLGLEFDHFLYESDNSYSLDAFVKMSMEILKEIVEVLNSYQLIKTKFYCLSVNDYQIQLELIKDEPDGDHIPVEQELQF